MPKVIKCGGKMSLQAFYVTKYVPTRGILKVQARVSERYAYYGPRRGPQTQVKPGKDAFATLEAAQAAAVQEAKRKVAAAKRALEKVESLLRDAQAGHLEVTDLTVDEEP